MRKGTWRGGNLSGSVKYIKKDSIEVKEEWKDGRNTT